MPRFAANIAWLFTEVPFAERFAAAAKAGFRAVELQFPYDHTPEQLKALLDANGLAVSVLNMPPGDAAAGDRGVAAIRGREAECAASVETAIRYATALRVPKLHCMAGRVAQGAERATFVANLKAAAPKAAAAGVTIVIEPLNTRDNPGYFLTSVEQAAEIIAEVGSPALGLQFDIYHRQMERGDVTRAMRAHAAITRHYQIANPPDRGEPVDGDLDHRFLLAEIDRLGYAGFVGLEYKPRAGTVPGLHWIADMGLSLG